MTRIMMAAAALVVALAGPARAQLSDNVVKLGVLTDMSSLYADINGPGAVVATQMAIDDFGGTVLGKRIELISADVQNKPDVATSIAGRWYDDEQVDVILGTGGSSSSIATATVANNKKHIYLATDPASSDLTGKLCNPYMIHWTYDTVALANGTGSAVVKAGGKTSFFLPQAQGSKAQIIGLANAGGDTINSIKQAAEFGIVKGGQKLAGLLVFSADVAALGLPLAQGLMLTETWYWDMNDSNRAWTKRWQAERPGKVPTMIH